MDLIATQVDVDGEHGRVLSGTLNLEGDGRMGTPINSDRTLLGQDFSAKRAGQNISDKNVEIGAS